MVFVVGGYYEESPDVVEAFELVGHPGIEPGTSCLSSMRSNQLS